MKKTLKRLLSILLCIILMFGTVAVDGVEIAEIFSTKASAATNPYPYWQTFTYNGKQYTTITCTYYAWEQVYNTLGISLPKWGNATTWLDYAQNAGYSTGNTPKKNSIAVWKSNDGGWGHVAFVTAVNGSSFTYNEGGTANQRANSLGIYENHPYPDGYTSYPSGFIYLQNEHTCDYNASVKITKAPTKTTTGTRTKTCSCGKSITQTIPAIPYTTDLKEGIYSVSCKFNSNLWMATNTNSSYNGNVWACAERYPDQYWLFRKNSDGTYTIESAYYDGYCLDNQNASTINSNNIRVYEDNSSDAQKYYVVPSGSYYKLVNKASYNNVDVENATGNLSDICGGTNISLYEDNGADNQLWKLTSSNPKVYTSSSSVEVSSGSSKTVTCTVSRKTQGIIMTSLIGDSNVCSTSWGKWDGMNIPITITGKSGGSTWITITLKDKDTGIVYDTNTFKISVPDTTKPKCSISTTNNVATFQNVKLSFSDDIGLTGYYWGTSSTYSNNTYYYTSGKSNSVATTVSSAGTYYLTAKDTYGNISSTASKTFYKTTLNANGGSVSTAYVITASGNSFTLPTPTREGYTFKGWNIYSGGTGTSYSGTYKPTSSINLYAQWASNHTHSYTKTVTPPTCTTQGYTTYTCSCGSSYKTDYVKAKGHTDGEWVITKPATFTETGIKTLYCKECGKVIKTEIIPVITGKVVSATINNIEVKYKNTATVNTEINTEGDVEYTVKYETSNPKVATVDNDGNITTYGKGTSEITCTVTDEYGNTVKDTCTVTVKFSFGQWLIWIFLLGFLWY